jgi:hypothetical protein
MKKERQRDWSMVQSMVQVKKGFPLMVKEYPYFCNSGIRAEG